MSLSKLQASALQIQAVSSELLRLKSMDSASVMPHIKSFLQETKILTTECPSEPELKSYLVSLCTQISELIPIIRESVAATCGPPPPSVETLLAKINSIASNIAACALSLSSARAPAKHTICTICRSPSISSSGRETEAVQLPSGKAHARCVECYACGSLLHTAHLEEGTVGLLCDTCSQGGDAVKVTRLPEKSPLSVGQQINGASKAHTTSAHRTGGNIYEMIEKPDSIYVSFTGDLLEGDIENMTIDLACSRMIFERADSVNLVKIYLSELALGTTSEKLSEPDFAEHVPKNKPVPPSFLKRSSEKDAAKKTPAQGGSILVDFCAEICRVRTLSQTKLDIGTAKRMFKEIFNKYLKDPKLFPSMSTSIRNNIDDAMAKIMPLSQLALIFDEIIDRLLYLFASTLLPGFLRSPFGTEFTHLHLLA